METCLKTPGYAIRPSAFKTTCLKHQKSILLCSRAKAGIMSLDLITYPFL